MLTVTVTRKGPKTAAGALAARYVVRFGRVPGATFGPWDFQETCRDLTVSAGLEPAEARDLVLDAWIDGTASRNVAVEVEAPCRP